MRLPCTVNLPTAKKRAAGRAPALAEVIRSRDGVWTRETVTQAFPPKPIEQRISDKDADAEIRTAIKAIEAAGIEAHGEYEDLPQKLRDNIERLIESDRYARELWQGGTAGNEHRFQLAALLKRHKFTVEEYASLAQVWHRSTSKPDRPNARELARDWVRSQAPAAQEFGAGDLGKLEPHPRDRSRFRVLSIAESEALIATENANPLIDGFLDQGTFVVMYGKPNCGKSFVALDIAGCIAVGRAWNDREVASGLVVYIAAEGGAGIHRRVGALAKEKRIPPDAPFRLVSGTIDFSTTDNDLLAIIREVDAISETYGPPKLIIVDTLARVLRGDENAGEDMGRFIEKIDRLREATGATVIVVHHTGKDASKGSRGHSSLLGAADTEIEIAKQTIRTTKQRDHEPLDPEIEFDLRTVDLGTDARGRPLTSCVVRYHGPDEFAPVPLDPAAERLLRSLVDMTSASGARATWAEWGAAHCRAVDPSWQPSAKPPRGCSTANLRKLRWRYWIAATPFVLRGAASCREIYDGDLQESIRGGHSARARPAQLPQPNRCAQCAQPALAFGKASPINELHH